jgi:hypothetical protein
MGAGTTTITASKAASTLYLAGSTQTTFTVLGITPTLGTFSIPTKTYGTSFNITPPSSNSTGTFSYTSSDTSVATVSGSTVTILKVGTTTITATQASSGGYGSATTTAELNIIKNQPTIAYWNYYPPTYKVYGDSPFTITTAPYGSGPFVYSSSNQSVVTVSGTTVTIVGAGTCDLIATIPETENSLSASIKVSVTINKKTPLITNFIIPAKVIGDSSFQITPPDSDSSGNFTYTSNSPSIATVSGNIITIVNSGSVNIYVTQAATSNFTTGTSYAVFKIKQKTILSNFNIPNKTIVSGGFQIPIPSSNNTTGTFSFTSSNNSVINVPQGSAYGYPTNPGICDITATQSETDFYGPASISTTVEVSAISTPILSNFSIPTKTFADPSFSIIAPTSNSNGSFSYTSSNSSIATISENIITIVGAGTCTITATQGEAPGYTTATISATFIVNRKIPNLRNFSIPSVNQGTNYITITPPLTDSPALISYTSSNENIAIAHGYLGTISVIVPGIVTITATQGSTSNFESASISTTFRIIPNPTFYQASDFNFNRKIVLGDLPFDVVDPSTNSTGTFTYTSSNPSVATVSGKTITIVGVGITIITVYLSATNDFTDFTFGVTLEVLEASRSNPVVLETSEALTYFLEAPAAYADLKNDIVIEIPDNKDTNVAVLSIPINTTTQNPNAGEPIPKTFKTTGDENIVISL